MGKGRGKGETLVSFSFQRIKHVDMVNQIKWRGRGICKEEEGKMGGRREGAKSVLCGWGLVE